MFALPHQNQLPVFSWNGRKITGILSFCNSFAYVAMVSKYAVYTSFFSPPGKIFFNESPDVSFDSLKSQLKKSYVPLPLSLILAFVKFGICADSVTIAPFAAASLLYLIEFSSAVFASVPPASLPNKASESIPKIPLTEPVTSLTSPSSFPLTERLTSF